MKLSSLTSVTLFSAVFFSSTLAQTPGPVGPSPYDFNTETWMQPFAVAGFTWGGTSGVYVESDDRIFVLQRGETQLPNPIPPEYTSFAGSLGWNVLQGRGRVWNNCIYVIDSAGNLLEVWNQWDYLFAGTDGPGPHRIRMSPYDPERRVWVIDETGHVIYVFSNDGSQLLMTLGEKNIPGTDQYHFTQPQDVAFLPDGKFLIADGLGNTRIVVRDADGSYLSEFGEAGSGPGKFDSVHSLAIGPQDRAVQSRRYTQIHLEPASGRTRPLDRNAFPVSGFPGKPLRHRQSTGSPAEADAKG